MPGSVTQGLQEIGMCKTFREEFMVYSLKVGLGFCNPYVMYVGHNFYSWPDNLGSVTQCKCITIIKLFCMNVTH